MKRLIPALIALAVLGGMPFAQTDDRETEDEALDIRLYDITDLLDHGFSEYAFDDFTNLKFDGELRGGGIFPPDESTTGKIYKGVPRVTVSDNLATIEKYVHDILELCGDTYRTDIVYTFPNHSRYLMSVAARPKSHEHLAFLLDSAHDFQHARIDMTVHENGQLIGTAMGRPGDNMKVAEFHWDAVAHDAYRYSSDMVSFDGIADGTEIVAWAVKLPDGALRVEGRITRREIEELRPVGTQGGTLEMPTFTVCAQHFAAEVTDPGHFIVTTADGSEFAFDVTCGADVSGYRRVMPDGTILAGLNLYGLLRGAYDRADPFGQDFEPYWGFDLLQHEFAARGRDYGDELAQVLGRSAGDSVDVQVNGIGGYVHTKTAAPGPEGTRDNSLDAFVSAVNDWVDAPVAKFRLRTWLTEEAEEYSPDTLGEPASEHELSIVEDQTVTLRDLRVSGYIRGYKVPVAASPVRQPWRDFIAEGDFIRLSLRRGRVEAVLKRQDVLEIKANDTGVRDPGPLIIESPVTRRHDLNFSARLTVGETITAITPTGNGQILLGELKRLE